MDQYAKNLKDFADKLASDGFTSEAQIKEEMEKLKLIYCSDEIERLNHVLLALHPLSKRITSDLTKNTHKELNH